MTKIVRRTLALALLALGATACSGTSPVAPDCDETLECGYIPDSGSMDGYIPDSGS